MVKSQEAEVFEQVIEKIVFDESELEELKIVITNFTEGSITPKQLKQKILQCRGRMVEDLTEFVHFFINEKKSENLKGTNEPILVLNSPNSTSLQLHQELKDKNELLEIIAKKVNQITIKLQHF